jgi:hypothetical protein
MPTFDACWTGGNDGEDGHRILQGLDASATENSLVFFVAFVVH